MKKTGIAACLLAAALLSGCTPKTPGTPAAGEHDIVQEVLGIPSSTTLLTIDGVDVPAGRYLFWLVNSIETEKYYGGLATDEDWIQQVNGMTMRDALKADALQTLTLYQVVENHAAQEGVTASQEDQDELDAQLQDLEEQAGGAEYFQNRMDSVCISKEDFRTINLVPYLDEALSQKLEERGELEVSQEELDGIIEENGLYGAKHILISTRRTNADGTGYEDFSDEEKAEALRKAQDLREQLRNAGDSEELFDELMNEYSEDGRNEDGTLVMPDGYTLVYAGQMVPEFEEGAMALKEGEISEPIESQFGYHIILRLPLDREELREQFNGEYKLNTILQGWIEDANVTTTSIYDELDPKVFYDTLQQVNEGKLMEAPTESGTPEESGEPQETPAG